MTHAQKLKKLKLILSVLGGVIPSRNYGEGPHAKKYARQSERIEEAQAACIDLLDELQPVEVQEGDSE